MNFSKKSLGQNFLIDKNIIKKIVNCTDIKDKNVIEIGPGKGALTDEIIKKKPKNFSLIEKDSFLAEILKKKYSDKKFIKVINKDILKINIEKIYKNNTVIFGNLPYNISSQILVKVIKSKKWPPKYDNLVFMFQKELGEKIIGKFPSSNYGRLSIISNFRLKIIKKFLVSPNCFWPKPKVTSMVIHLGPLTNTIFNIKKLENLEKITNIIFSNKRKMVNKSINKILKKENIMEIDELNLNSRPSDIKPEIYYKITELYEQSH